MSDKIAPALTPEEWRQALRYGVDTSKVETGPFSWWEQHQIATLALFGQPFGFTREDVATFRYVLGPSGPWSTGPFEWLESLAARIEALLPPEAP